MEMTSVPVELHLRTDANNLVTTAASTQLPEHMIQMLRQEACSGQMHDLAHLTHSCLADPLTKKSVSTSLLIFTFQSGVLQEVGRFTVQHKDFMTDVIFPDSESTVKYWTHSTWGPV